MSGSERVAAGHAVARLAALPDKHFADRAAWQRHPRRLRSDALQHSLAPARLASEDAVWGSVTAHGLLPDTVTVSDEAGPAPVRRRSARLVRAERLVHTLDTFTDWPYGARQHRRALIWWFDADRKAYRRRTGFAALDRLLARLHATKDARSWSCSTGRRCRCTRSGSERDLRPQVIRRKISGGTRSRRRGARAATPSSACC